MCYFNKILPFLKILKNLNYFLLLKNMLLNFAKHLIKLNIKVLCFITHNPLCYFLYIGLIIYGFFGSRQQGVYDTLHLFVILIVSYIIVVACLI